MSEVEIVEVELDRDEHCEWVLALVDQYAQDPMGNEQPLDTSVRESLIQGLKAHPTTLIFVALVNQEPLGIAVCFRGFSTFAAKPLINLHDLYVHKSTRGTNLGRTLLEAISEKARKIGACKVTLEVQSQNHRAQSVYTAAGFTPPTYAQQADPVLFLTKPI